MNIESRYVGTLAWGVLLTILYAIAADTPHANAISLTGQNAAALGDTFQNYGRPSAVPGFPKAVAAPNWRAGPDQNRYESSTDLILGGSELVALITEKGAKRDTAIEQEFAIDSSSFGEWYKFSSDFSFGMEFDELLDFRAVAVATYDPEIQYWLDGNRWAELGSGLPSFNPVTPGGKKPAGNQVAGPG